MKWLYRIVCAILVVVMLVSAYQIWNIMAEYKAGEDAYEEMEQFIDIPSQVPTTTNPDEEDESSTQFPTVDFASLQQINEDVVAWLYIPNTHVNYPVVQGSDNSYYLNHLFTKEWNSAGSIFVDYRNEADFSDLHTVIYGHQMNNRTMFNDLKLYEDQSFYDQQPVGYLLTPEGAYVIEFFSGYVSSVDTNAWDMNFTEDSFVTWLQDIKSRSAFTSQVEPQAEDKVVTLSTCSSAFANARFVLHGVLRPVENG